MAFATVDDLQARWRVLSEPEQERAAVLLEDASVMLSSLVAIDSEDPYQADLLKVVCCSMVQRSMMASEQDAFGVTQQTVSADIYSRSMTFANPSGDMYLTRNEKKLLGIGTGYIGSIPVKVGDSDD